MAEQTLSCPHCGLVLTIKSVKGGTRLSYDPASWRKLCRHAAFDSPVLCLLKEGAGDGAGAERGSNGGAGDIPGNS